MHAGCRLTIKDTVSIIIVGYKATMLILVCKWSLADQVHQFFVHRTVMLTLSLPLWQVRGGKSEQLKELISQTLFIPLLRICLYFFILQWNLIIRTPQVGYG